MVDKGFRLTVFTQEKAVLDQQALSIVAPGSEGYLGVLRDHAPLVTRLVPGKLTVKDLNGDEAVYVVSGGFLEVSRNTVTILADALERPEEIDATRAEAAARRARERLEKRSTDLDVDRAEAALRRALNRLKVRRDVLTAR
jgi:F-type H+-transporting ATPase subunit epsilon